MSNETPAVTGDDGSDGESNPETSPGSEQPTTTTPGSTPGSDAGGGNGGTGDGSSNKKTASPSEVATVVAQITGLISPAVVLAGVLTLSGNFGRAQLNEPELVIAGVIALLLTGLFWVVAGLIPARPARNARDLKIMAVVLAVAGNGLILGGTIQSASKQASPRITATLNKSADRLTIKVQSERLAIDERVAMFVDGMGAKGKGTVATQPLYESSFGPTEEGKVDQKVSFSLPPGSYTSIRVKAYSNDISTKCIVKPTEKPALQPGRQASSTLTIAASSVPTSDEQAACVLLPVVSTKVAKAGALKRAKFIAAQQQGVPKKK